MDAQAHLLSLGWAGPGHSLDSRPYKQKGHRGLAYDPAKVGNNGNGLVKPLLISQRKGRLGIGKKAHEPQAGNQWWLKGFESALGNIGKSESERSSGASTPVAQQHPQSGKHGWLYSFFVKGQDMQGTIGRLDDVDQDDGMRPKKRKSDVLDEQQSIKETAVDGSKKKRKRDDSKEKAVAEFEQVSTYIALRDKDEKRRRRTERPSPVEEFRQVSEYMEVRSGKKDGKKKKKRHGQSLEEAHVSEGTSTPAVTEGEGDETGRAVETKEERRERRRRRKEEKEKKRKKTASQGDTTTAEDEAVRDGKSKSLGRHKEADETADDAAAKAARRAERKKRKAEKAAKAG
ncbi:hypothetical protein ABEF95_006531 [Exophiala dermatitidis]